MAKKFMGIALVLIIGLAAWLAYYFSDKEVVKRQLTTLAVELGKQGQETPVQMALKMRVVKDMLAARCQVVIPERGYHEDLEPDLIIRYLIYHRNRYALVNVVFEDMVVDIPGEGRAAVQTVVRLRRQTAGQVEAETVETVEQVALALTKGDDTWLLDKVSMPEALVD